MNANDDKEQCTHWAVACRHKQRLQKFPRGDGGEERHAGDLEEFGAEEEKRGGDLFQRDQSQDGLFGVVWGRLVVSDVVEDS